MSDVNVPEGYKSTDVGVIPEDWEVKEISEIVESDRPISYGIVQTGKHIDNGVRCIRVVDIIDGRINEDDLIKTSEKISNSYKRTILKENDLVIALRGKIGELGIINKKLAGENLTRGVALIAAKSIYHSCFLYYYLSSFKNKSILEKNLNGSALKEISIGILRKIPAVLPPLSEQKAIARVLSDVDDLIRECDSLLAKKRDIKQGTMQQLLTSKKRLPGFSGDWKEKKVGEICDFIVPGRNKPKTFDGDIPWITTPDLEDGKSVYQSKSNLFISEEEAKNVGSKIVPTDSVLMSCAGELGIVALTKKDLVINQQLHAFIPSSVIDAFFLLNAIKLKKQYINSISTITAVPYLNKNNCNSIPICFPTLAEQKAIAQILSDMDAAIEALEKKRDKYKAIKQGMMQELLTGKTRLIEN
jgi:type I restriction enzyme, S subunit